MKDNNIIYGRNPVIESLKSNHSINKILVADGARDGSIKKITALALEHKVNVEFVPRAKLDRLVDGQNHQGVVAYAPPVNYHSLDDLLDAKFLLLLDEIQDPHNFGAILRSADAFGVDGVLIPKHRSVSLNATVAKTSAGAVEYVRVAQIGNVAHTLRYLKDRNFTVVGGVVDGHSILETPEPIDLNAPIVLAVGSEGKGLRRLTRELCDQLIRIPMVGKINSLNASTAGAILMFEIFRRRHPL